MSDFFDAASGVFGEEAFQQLLVREISRASRYNDFFSLCLAKPDGTGRAAIDERLQQAVARKIAQVLRSTDVVGHTRDGVVILLLNTPYVDAVRIAERLRAHVETVRFSVERADVAPQITLSMGLVSFPGDGSTHGALLARAKTYLEEAVRAGGNRVAFSAENAH
jgi:diguanylate cyclase (GGDEF)-like protein